jgi:hypothetical protein
MSLRSASASGFEGLERVYVSKVVVAETKMWRTALLLLLFCSREGGDDWSYRMHAFRRRGTNCSSLMAFLASAT